MGVFADAVAAHRLRAAWRKIPWPDWRGQPVVVVGSGPSAGDCNLEDIRGRARVVVVNSSFRLAPWADALYARDEVWWRAYREEVASIFKGLRVSADVMAALNLRDLNIRPAFEITAEDHDVVREILAHDLQGNRMSLG